MYERRRCSVAEAERTNVAWATMAGDEEGTSKRREAKRDEMA
jgi:hypothetical protein